MKAAQLCGLMKHKHDFMVKYLVIFDTLFFTKLT